MKKCVVFLADLSYIREDEQWTIVPIPLNVGFLAAFLNGMQPGAFDITIFKNPKTLLAALSNARPDVVAFSNYIWNKNLSLQFAAHVKRLHPGCITAMGGPNYNFGESAWLEAFARANPQVDFHIEGEGEVKLYNLIACALEHGLDVSRVKAANPAAVAFIDDRTDTLVSNQVSTPSSWMRLDGVGLDLKAGRLLDLNDVPSPYLTGLLDDFLRDPNYCPIIETNRGCPYACTFCNWGDMGKSRSSQFSHERVQEELRYIAATNVSKTPILYMGDANFGMFERDVAIANLVRELRDTTGYPRNVYLYYAKNHPQRVSEIAEIFWDMTRINLSRQTQNPEVLANIKRSNISLETFRKLADLAKSLGAESLVELIYGLPGESKESFFAGIREVMGQGVDGVHLFPAMLLDGSEMGSQASRDQYGIKGEFRRIDGSAGVYGPIAAMEFEEIVTESHAMSRDDYFSIRLFHVFQVLFLDSTLYRATETLIGEGRLFDLIEDVIEHADSAPPALRHLVDEFMAAAKAELLSAPPTTVTVDDVDEALAGSIKLNPLFVCKILYDGGVREAFHAYLKLRILRMGHASAEDVDNVLGFIGESIYPFDGTERKVASMAFDAMAFADRPLTGSVRAADYALPEPRTYRYVKPFTFREFVDDMPADLPLASKVYDVLLHHTHQMLRNTVTWALVGEEVVSETERFVRTRRVAAVGDGRRQIENEGAWLY